MSETSASIVVNFGEAKQKTIDGIQIDPRNVPTGMSANAQTTSDKTVSVQVIGVQSVIDNISSNQIKAYVDLSGYTEGTHSVPVQVEGEDARAQYIVTSSVNIVVSQK